MRLFSPKNSPVPVTLTWHDESDHFTQEEKVHCSQTKDMVVQNNVSDTCNSDHGVLSIVKCKSFRGPNHSFSTRRL
jgi:hypothetical protein